MNHETTQHTAHPHGSHSGESVRDPVCGMNVDPKPASESDSFAGQTYFFCSQDCLAKFRSEPTRYARQRPAPSVDVRASSATVAGEYTCPMHPEIRQQGPGACPKCGMTLEPVAPLAARQTEYVCPMHPEVVRNEPGNCPICGMALEPKTASVGEEQIPSLPI